MSVELQDRIVFFTNEKTKADLKIKLYRDGLTQTKFFNAVVEAYIRDKEEFMSWYASERMNLIKNNTRHGKLCREERLAAQAASAYALNEDELGAIFDLIAEEQE